MKFLCVHPESDCFWIEDGKDYEEVHAKVGNGEVDISEISEGNMVFKHYATDELKQVKIIVCTTSETIVEDVRTDEMLVVVKDKQHGRYKIKGTSFIKIE